MVDVSTMRSAALAGRAVRHEWVDVAPVHIARRWSLRAPGPSVEPVSSAIGIALPTKPRLSVKDGDLAALCLGPDEWLLLDNGSNDRVQDLRNIGAFHSIVDVSHRNVGIRVKGSGAVATMAAGCPQDLSSRAFPVGTCARTLLGKVEIVLWRTEQDTFHVECWRSFCEYAFGFLEEAARDAGV
jgi:sarcosine oxidase subunit gamma